MDPFFHKGLKEIAGRYDGFILDLWGVVHDGKRPYPGAVGTLSRLRGLGKKVVLLSNAPRPADTVAAFLAAIGVGAECYDDLITSGGLVREMLAAGGSGLPGRRCLMIGSTRAQGVLEGLDYPLATVEEADFILCCGLADDERETVEEYHSLLRAAAGRSLPMICANPDLTVMRGEQLLPCAGGLARIYAELGGEVRYYGKPYPAAYDACFARLGMAKDRILAIGDSLRTDVAGARQAGIAVLLVPGGIHAEEWGVAPGGLPKPEPIEATFAATGLRPTGVLAGLNW